MKKPYNVPLRVKHFNNQIKDKEALIEFDATLFSNVNNPKDYSTRLYRKALRKGRVLEEKNGWFRLFKNNKKQKILVQGQSYLHILFCLEKRAQDKVDKYWDKVNEEGNIDSDLSAEEFEAKYGIGEHELEDEEHADEPNSAGFQLIEVAGVTFIKDTNFVISKFL